MKKLILAFLLTMFFAGSAWAQEYWILCDPADPNDLVTQVKYVLDGQQEQIIPYQEINGNCRIVNVTAIGEGHHTIIVKFTNAWGDSDPVPFTFPGSAPGNPQGIIILKLEP